jgi:hypothetical protein
MSKFYNSIIKKTTTENKMGIIENIINDNNIINNKINEVIFKSFTFY